MICDTGLHRWRYAEALMDTAKVVMHEVQRNSMGLILHFLAEGVR